MEQGDRCEFHEDCWAPCQIEANLIAEIRATKVPRVLTPTQRSKMSKRHGPLGAASPRAMGFGPLPPRMAVGQ